MRHRVKRKLSKCYYHNSISISANARIDGKHIAFAEIPKDYLLIKGRITGTHLCPNRIDENADWEGESVFRSIASHKLGISHILYHGVPIENLEDN